MGSCHYIVPDKVGRDNHIQQIIATATKVGFLFDRRIYNLDGSRTIIITSDNLSGKEIEVWMRFFWCHQGHVYIPPALLL